MNRLSVSKSLFRQVGRNVRGVAQPLARFYSTQDTRSVTLIPGDGMGPEITESVVQIFKAADVPIAWDTIEIKGSIDDGTETSILTEKLHISILQNKFVLKGPLYAPIGKGHTSIDKLLALKYDLFAHVVPCQSPDSPYPMVYRDLNMAIIRENQEAEFSGLEHEVVPGVVESLKVVTRAKSARIAKYAFEYAKQNGHTKVIAVHKANIMKLADGLFLSCAREAAKENPDIAFEEMIVDNCSMQLVTYPRKFKNAVVVTTNLYGSIVSNIAAGLVGGSGVLGGFNIGPDAYVFEQGTRHVALDIAGKNIANPVGLLQSSVMMLKKMNLNEHANRIDNALKTVLKDGKVLTPDLGGSATTTDFTSAVISKLE